MHARKIFDFVMNCSDMPLYPERIGCSVIALITCEVLNLHLLSSLVGLFNVFHMGFIATIHLASTTFLINFHFGHLFY